MATKNIPCPGSSIGDRDEDFKFECNVCGRRIAKLGYSSALAPHKAPTDVVNTYWDKRRKAMERREGMTKVYVDMESGTWGVASNLAFKMVDQETLNSLDNMSDTEIKDWVEGD